MIYALTLTWNNKNKLSALLNSLIEVEKTCNLKWLIRNNDSEDGTDKIEFPEFVHYFKYHTNDENFSQGNNYLYKKAVELGLTKDDYILLLNDDIIFKDYNSLNKILNLMDGTVGAIGTKLLFPDGKLQHAGVVFVENDKGKFPHNYRGGEANDEKASKNREFQAVTGACLLIKASCIYNIFLDPAYSWGYEDIDLCLRLKSKGKRILYCGETNIIHNESSSLNKNPMNHKFFFKNLAHFNRRWTGKFNVDITKFEQNELYGVI